jgi:transcriptional regulator with PAS, ATPase and Fis domain
MDRPITLGEQGSTSRRESNAYEQNPGSAAAQRSTLVIESPAMHELVRLARCVAETTAPVLLLGETGTGKEVLARFIHERSGRGCIKAVNCAALPAQLLESVLFGHERGAFTGAMRSTAGLFEQAEGGTVLLDEVGELSAAAQAALLRVLESAQVTRVGSDHDIPVDVRMLTATHRDLTQMVAQGKFRQDLLYRINAITLELPPLRERCEEILPLAEVFLAQAARRWQRPVRDLCSAVRELFVNYLWPGNIRELRNVVERGVLLCEGRILDTKHLPAGVRTGCDSAAFTEPVPAVTSAEPSVGLRSAVRRYEAQFIARALERANGNQSRAAELLQIPRRTLVRKLKTSAQPERRRKRQ